MPVITPGELIVYLDLPHETQPTDRATLIVDLVLGEIARAAKPSVLAEPYPDGLKGIALVAAARLYDNPTRLASLRVNTTSENYSGGPEILTQAEKETVASLAGSSTAGPQFSFPEPDWSWTVVPAQTWSEA